MMIKEMLEEKVDMNVGEALVVLGATFVLWGVGTYCNKKLFDTNIELIKQKDKVLKLTAENMALKNRTMIRIIK